MCLIQEKVASSRGIYSKTSNRGSDKVVKIPIFAEGRPTVYMG